VLATGSANGASAFVSGAKLGGGCQASFLGEHNFGPNEHAE
jgi:hypothetical protein